MKKIIIILLAGLFLLSLNSCKSGDVDYSIKDALKISAYLFDENSGEDYFIYDKSTNKYDYNREESVFGLEQLKMNEIRLMSPLSFGMLNLNIHFEFDGIIEVISEDKDVQMFYNNNSLYEPIRGTTGSEGSESYGFEMKLLNEGFIAVNPLGSNRGNVWAGNGINRFSHSVGREYYLDVNAYKFDNEQHAVIRAQLKLVQLEDKTDISSKSSGCFSIELISYEYSDMYKIMDDIVDDEE